MALDFTSRYARTKKYDNTLFDEPSCTQELFPVKSVDPSGIFELNNNLYSKAYILSDINFTGVTDSEQKEIIINFKNILNSMSCRFSYCVAKESTDDVKYNQNMLYKHQNDQLDWLRDDFNEVIIGKVKEAKQGLYQTIYLTLTIKSESFKDAKTEFGSIESVLRSMFMSMGTNGLAGSKMEAMSLNERMQRWYNLTHLGIRSDFNYNFETEIRQGHFWQNTVAPDSIEFFDEYFILNGCQYGKVLWISKYANTMDSNIMSQLSKVKCTSYITLNSELISNDALKQELLNKSLRINHEISSQNKKNVNNKNFFAEASHISLDNKKKIEALDKEITDGDDHFFNTTVLILLIASSEVELKSAADTIYKYANNNSYDISNCFGKQREGINSAFIFGAQEFKRCVNFSAPCHAMFMPFKTQEISDPNGTFYGVNQISQNAILGDRKRKDLLNKNGIFSGKSGAGKSVFVKLEILSSLIGHPEDKIIIIDPQNEYGKIAKLPGVNGSVIKFDNEKEIYINPMDVDFENVDYSQLQQIISDKSDFLLTLISSCIHRPLDPDEQGIIDSVINRVYSDNFSFRRKINGINDLATSEFSVPNYMKKHKGSVSVDNELSNDEQIKAYSPMLQDIYQELKDMENNETAHNLASYMNIFVNGSLNLFNHRTNVSLDSRFLVFNISKLKQNLRDTCILVMLEIVRDQLKKNFAQGMYTRIYIDEFHELLGQKSIAEFVDRLWREVRKNYGMMTGITQKISDLFSKNNDINLDGIFGNSEYFVLLSQDSRDHDTLRKVFPSISPALFSYVVEAESGTGLLKLGNVSVPFDIKIPDTSHLYKMINTDDNQRFDDD